MAMCIQSLMESAVAQDLLLEENANMLDNIRNKISNVYYDIIDLNWKYFGKVLVVIVPAVVWTITYYIIKYMWAGAEVINRVGGDALESFLEK